MELRKEFGGKSTRRRTVSGGKGVSEKIGSGKTGDLRGCDQRGFLSELGGGEKVRTNSITRKRRVGKSPIRQK